MIVKEVFFLIVLNSKDEVIDWLRTDLFPTNDMIYSLLERPYGENVSVKIDKRYVLEEM